VENDSNFIYNLVFCSNGYFIFLFSYDSANVFSFKGGVGYVEGYVQEMKIMLINIDSTIPNLALHKIAMYHEQQGDEVVWDIPLIKADKTYVSCVFDYNKHLCKQWEGVANAVIGGSGWALDSRLPLDIEDIKPKINFGFTTRGCIRKCPFCIVPAKEGHIRVVGDIYDIWDGKSKELTIMDNNILAVPDHFKMICEQLKKEKLLSDFNQGLDCRLLTEELAFALKGVRLKELRFAFDNLNVYPSVVKCVNILNKVGLGMARWYVYTDENFESALERLLILKRLGQNTYVMRDKRIHDQKKYIDLSRWSSHPPLFFETDFWEFIEYRKGKYQEVEEKQLF
jgi:hypothetical protein